MRGVEGGRRDRDGWSEETAGAGAAMEGDDSQMLRGDLGEKNDKSRS